MYWVESHDVQFLAIGGGNQADEDFNLDRAGVFMGICVTATDLSGGDILPDLTPALIFGGLGGSFTGARSAIGQDIDAIRVFAHNLGIDVLAVRYNVLVFMRGSGR